MQEVKRNDVQIDVCPKRRGVWLNRVELEKLLHPAPAEQDQVDSEAFREQEDPLRRKKTPMYSTNLGTGHSWMSEHRRRARQERR